ncbi:hypothetical protein [Butyrivibrio sp. FCS006]|uniref:hypothetical protein n=1 Tax=Butyrivibrio sp. FCS006 TaxID=1280684 RepID=UPI0003FA073A|nr:hypothetical protein [Butyrivibrio sp. FCS006]
MSFDISRLTKAVNKYLNSISDIGQQATQRAQEMADKAQFQADLSEAIKANIQSKTREIDEVPDIGAMVQSQVKSATDGINATFEQINGAFLEISEAGKSTSSAKESVAATSGADKSGSSSTNASTAKSANADAYAGTLSTEALKELSNSGYFSGNLIANSLFKTNDEESTSSGSTNALNSVTSALTSSLGQSTTTAANPFQTQSLDQLNVNSLLANSLGVNTTATDSLTAALKTVADKESSSTAAKTTDSTAKQTSGDATVATSNDLAKAIIKAYTTTAKATANTSIFGDFSL